MRREAFLVLVASAALSLPAFGQATRTWVSGVGDDANPCSRTAPCKTFAGAISKTAAAGVINALDSAGFGTVTITKSITIATEQVVGGVLQAGVNGVIVNAGPNDTVILRGLDFEGIGTGLNGIRFIAGGNLVVEKCWINNVTQRGIDFEPTAATASTLTVKDTIIRNATLGAILIKPGSGGTKAVIDNVRTERGNFGLRAEDNAKVTVRNSSFGLHVGNGVLAFSAVSAATVTLEGVVSWGNGAAGVKSEGTNALATVSNVMVTGNAFGFQSASSGKIATFGNNKNSGNTSNGTPTEAISPQQ